MENLLQILPFLHFIYIQVLLPPSLSVGVVGAVQSGIGADCPVDCRLLFTSWLSRKIQEFLAVLESDLTTGVPRYTD